MQDQDSQYSPLTIPIIHCSICVKYSLRNGRKQIDELFLQVCKTDQASEGESVSRLYANSARDDTDNGNDRATQIVFGCRYAFTILSNVLVFSCIWVLLSKINNNTDVTNLTPNDKKIFWVSSVQLMCLRMCLLLLVNVITSYLPGYFHYQCLQCVKTKEEAKMDDT